MSFAPSQGRGGGDTSTRGSKPSTPRGRGSTRGTRGSPVRGRGRGRGTAMPTENNAAGGVFEQLRKGQFNKDANVGSQRGARSKSQHTMQQYFLSSGSERSTDDLCRSRHDTAREQRKGCSISSLQYVFTTRHRQSFEIVFPSAKIDRYGVYPPAAW